MKEKPGIRGTSAVILTAIVAIFILELMALWKGIDGVALAAAIGGISFLAGGGTRYVLAKRRK